jgi:hypothetical protein
VNGGGGGVLLRLLPRLRSCSSGTDQIAAEFIKAGGEVLRSEIHKFFNVCME